MAIPGPVPRRLVSVSAATAAVAGLTLLMPLAVPVLLAVDLVRRDRFPLSRGILMLWIFAIYEFAGILAAAALWLGRAIVRPRPAEYAAWTGRFMARWGGGLFQWIALLYSLDVRITGEEAVRAPGPVVFLMRHSGIVDTLVPPGVVSLRNGRPLRYIVKDELLWDPCLDILGTRFPNVFVRRDGKDTAGQVAAIRRLVGELADDEGVLLYPEGTRFTERKRARILEKLRGSDQPAALARAESLKRVLPPRRGGTLAVLQSAPQADVIIAGNVGFEWATSKRQFWSGKLIGRRIHIDFRRIPAGEVPRDEEPALAWLGSEWAKVDRWVQDREERE